MEVLENVQVVSVPYMEQSYRRKFINSISKLLPEPKEPVYKSVDEQYEELKNRMKLND